MAGASLTAVPVHAASRTGTTRTLVLTPATLFNTGPLSFGNLISGATTGTATIAPDGGRSTTGGVTMAGGTVRAASFEGMNDTGGWPLQAVRITIPTTSITLTRVGGGPTMTVNNFTNSLGPGFFGFYLIPANGYYTFTVGGRLMVGANQPAGVYNGTFTVEAEYE